MPRTTLELTPRAPFDFKQSLERVKTFKAAGINQTVQAGILKVAFDIGTLVIAELGSVGTVKAPALSCALYSAKRLTKAQKEEARTFISTYLSLYDELEPFYKIAKKDPAFEPVLKRLYGYHLVKFPSLFACACWALVTQRTPNSFAFKTMAKLTDLLGTSLKQGEERYTVFPEPQAFLAPGAAPLILEATNNTRKTERLLPIARAFATADRSFLREAPYAEVEKWLKGIHGLGQWSVDYIMLRGLGRFERAPWTDTWLLDAVSQVYTGGLQISRGDARALAERYGWYQGLWVHYLKTYLW